MHDTTNANDVSRRTVLKKSAIASGVAFVGGLPLTRTTAASRDDLTSWIESDGRWLAFPSQTRLWRRSKQPIDLREDGGAGRWHAGPASDGNVRCRVENDGGVANAGFYVSVGRMAEIDSITVEAESVRSDRDGDTAQLTLALYFDVSGEGEYLAWEQILGWDELKRNTERWTGFGGDVEGVAFGAPADEQVTVDDETELTHFPPDETVTFGDYRDGKGGVEPDTDVALQVGVWGGGADTVEEAVVEAVTVERS